MENKKADVIIATGREKGEGSKITRKTIRKMRFLIRPEEKNRENCAWMAILLATICEVLYTVGLGEDELLVGPFYIGCLLLAIMYFWGFDMMRAYIDNKSLGENFRNEIMEEDGCIVIKAGEKLIDVLSENDDIAIFEYGNVVIVAEIMKGSLGIQKYIAKIEDIQSFRKMVDKKLTYYII